MEGYVSGRYTRQGGTFTAMSDHLRREDRWVEKKISEREGMSKWIMEYNLVVGQCEACELMRDRG
jgi:hypothetical protein